MKEFDQLKQGWRIDTAMAREAIKESFGDTINLAHSIIDIGGQGGQATAAGGGGGGAIGKGARGGRGGRGGDVMMFGSDGSPASNEGALAATLQSLKEATRDLDFNPGAGGGGAGTLEDGGTAGDGGNGGNILRGRIDLQDLQTEGPVRFELVIGKGGQGSSLPGQHSIAGEDSVIKIIASNGTVLRTLRAHGGAAVRSAASRLHDGVAEVSPQDLAGGFRVTTLTTVNAAEFRENLLFALGANWTRYPVPALPMGVVWNVFCAVQWRSLAGVSPRGVFLSLLNPSGNEMACIALEIPESFLSVGGLHWLTAIGANLDTQGGWTLRIHAAGLPLADYEVLVEIVDAPR